MREPLPPHLNILFVDDDADDHEFFLHAVAKADINTPVKIKTAKDASALAKALMNGYGRLPEIIFLDINMPIKNGHQVLEEIRSHRKLDDVAIAIFTTSSNPEDIHKAHDMGANLYIKKPGNLPDLVEMIEKVLMIDWSEHRPHSSIKNFIWEKPTEKKI